MKIVCVSYFLILLTGLLLDCSQSRIFSRDCRDIVRLTVDGGHLAFQMYRGGGCRVLYMYHLRPLSNLDIHARWQPVTKCARSRRSYGKIEDYEQSRLLSDNSNSLTYKPQKRQSPTLSRANSGTISHADWLFTVISVT